ncbi:hypothetical protein GCM10020221_34880 [Streptomyces thioluteus]|uniref:Uncharacterized protein n=1 Tax=Streptomyces thioluteus TaxID=66431 RepID=A0ABP6JKA1_STRTU
MISPASFRVRPADAASAPVLRRARGAGPSPERTVRSRTSPDPYETWPSGPVASGVPGRGAVEPAAGRTGSGWGDGRGARPAPGESAHDRVRWRRARVTPT